MSARENKLYDGKFPTPNEMVEKDLEAYNRLTKKYHIPETKQTRGAGISLDDLVQFSGNPERVSIMDPIAYQTRANSNHLDDYDGSSFDIKRTTFYAKEEK